MNRALVLLSGAGTGAGLMYFLDPDRGHRRRAMLRDKAIRSANVASDTLDKASRDLNHRVSGRLVEIRSLLSTRDMTDDVVVARARSKMGRLTSHPGAIEVTAHNGHVTLSGPILSHEISRLLHTVSNVPGVTAIDNRLQPYETPIGVPGLQTGPFTPGERLSIARANWPPSARVLAMGTGAGLIGIGAVRRGIVGTATGLLGLGLFARGLSNVEIRQLIGLGAGTRGMDIHKTATIAAPVERVFARWTHYETFPRFMTHVREVREITKDRSHWIVDGPAGMPLEWDATLTQYVPNQTLAWKTLPGSATQHTGVIHFQPTPEGGTRIDIRMSYTPPVGALGYALAALSGTDPKHALDDDLVRFKSLLEYGKTSAHGQEITRDELPGDIVERTPQPAAPAPQA